MGPTQPLAPDPLLSDKGHEEAPPAPAASRSSVRKKKNAPGTRTQRRRRPIPAVIGETRNLDDPSDARQLKPANPYSSGDAGRGTVRARQHASEPSRQAAARGPRGRWPRRERPQSGSCSPPTRRRPAPAASPSTSRPRWAGRACATAAARRTGSAGRRARATPGSRPPAGSRASPRTLRRAGRLLPRVRRPRRAQGAASSRSSPWERSRRSSSGTSGRSCRRPVRRAAARTLRCSRSSAMRR